MTDELAASVHRSWDRVDAWLAAHAPASLARLHPGADPAALAAAEETLGFPLPAELTASLLRHDGADPDVWVLPGLRLLSAAGVVDQWELKTQVRAELFDEGDEGDEDGEPGEADLFWDRRWVPVAHFQGDLDTIDGRPGPTHGRLALIGHDEDRGDFSPDRSWPSLAAYLAAVADQLTTGRAGVEPPPFDEPWVSPAGELLWGWPPAVPGVRGTAEENGYRRAPVGLPD